MGESKSRDLGSDAKITSAAPRDVKPPGGLMATILHGPPEHLQAFLSVACLPNVTRSRHLES
jgi:hypothetical protein